MKSLSPAARLSLGLVLLTLAILLAAQTIGLTPNAKKQQLSSRQHFIETLALQTTFAVDKQNGLMLQALLKTLVTKNPQLHSAGFRLNDRTLVADAGNHREKWRTVDNGLSTPTHVQIPILTNGQRRGTLELHFEPLGAEDGKVLGLQRNVLLLGFITVCGFFGYWFFIRRTLRYLDPSSVVPARVSAALNIMAEGVLILDRRDTILLGNNTFAKLLGISTDKLVGRNANQLCWFDDNRDQSSTPLPWQLARQDGISKHGEHLCLRTASGETRIFNVNAVPIQGERGKVLGTMSSFEDITLLEQKNSQLQKILERLKHSNRQVESKNRELEILATRDGLTNCLNRRSLFDALERNFSKAQTSEAEFSCIMVDIDHFKQINDNYGHTFGDQVIKMMADTLKHIVRSEDEVGRYGGEEFCVLLPGASLEIAYEVAERCRKQLNHQELEQIKITASFGISSIKLGAPTATNLIQQADEALYASKTCGRNRVTRWNPEISKRTGPDVNPDDYFEAGQVSTVPKITCTR